MKVQFASQLDTAIRLQARLVDKGSLPADLEPVVRAGAEAARFTGKTGQVFESSFVERGGAVVRLALVGAAILADAGRPAALERAGGAGGEVSRFGEVVKGAPVRRRNAPDQAVAVLLGLLRLRAGATTPIDPAGRRAEGDAGGNRGHRRAEDVEHEAWAVEACIA